MKWLLFLVLAATAIYVARPYWKSEKVAYSENSFFEVKRGDLLISVIEEGALRAMNETVIRSALEGYNRIIHLVPEGSHVQKGELLVEMDSAGLRDRLSEQELQYQDRLFQLSMAKENLKIQMSMAESQIKDGELRIVNSEDDLEKYRDGEAPLQLKTVDARMGVLKEQVRIARERYARTQELYKNGNSTRSELEADQLTLKREELALSQYEEDKRLIQKYDQPNQIRQLESNLIQAKQELDRLRMRTSNELGQAEADLKSSQRSIELMEEAIGLLKQKLANTKIFAPQDGLVVYAQVSPFQNTGQNDRNMMMGGRGGRGGGFGDGGGGEFRGGGGRRGNRSNAGEGRSGGAASGAQAVADANQRIASAISGAAPAESGGGGSASAGGGGVGRSGGGGGGGGGSASAAAGFASYQSMRPSSSMPARSSTIASSATPSTAGSSVGSSVSTSSSMGLGNQNSNNRSRNNLGPDYDLPYTMGVLEEGLMVRQRQELIRLPDISKMIAEVKIGESRVRQVRAGMPAYIRVENLPDKRFKGVVRRVALLPDAQAAWMNPDVKVFPTDVLVDNDMPDLKPGVSARVEIVITNLSKVLSVPIQTVARAGGENVCYVRRGAGVVAVPVTTGWFNDRFVEIKSGLKEGDKVLLAPVSEEDEFDWGPEPESTNGVSAASPESMPAVEAAPGEEAPQGRRGGGGRGGRGGRRGQSQSAEEPE